MPAPVIKLENVSKGFGDRLILKEISLEVGLGDLFGLIGSSGAGKTTMLKVMVGFMQPERGEVLYNAKLLRDPKSGSKSFTSISKSIGAIKGIVGFAAQIPSFYPDLTVFENLDYFGALFNLKRKERKANTISLMGLMDLQSSRNKIARNLSGGMQKRLDIACALMHNPRVLILDEPTADLDPYLTSHIWALLKKINRRGTTIIVSSHHVDELEDSCSRIGFLDKGRLMCVGAVSELTRKATKKKRIHLSSFPGDYEKIIKKIGSPESENRGHELVIMTDKPETILPELLKELKKEDELLIDLKIERPPLDELFAE